MFLQKSRAEEPENFSCAAYIPFVRVCRFTFPVRE